MTEGPLAGQCFPVEAQLVLGRASTADVAIDDTLISRRHALVRPADSSLEIEDLGSLNGTWVNGERLQGSRQLAVGDVVRVGSTSFRIAPDSAESGGTVLAPVPKELSRPSSEPDRAPVAPGPADASDSARSEDELRPVTALFADIVGSTTLGERLSPDEVKVVIGEFVSRMTRSVERYGGVVQAYMGDGIAAFFGISQAHEDDPERAARAALAILGDVGEYGREIEAAWGISDFNARIGINTGETAVGLVGAADPKAVSLGDTTNVAARLQAAADPGSIVVGEATAQALLQTFVLDSLGELTVKGRQQPVSAWRLVGPQAVARVAPATPLIDREDEMARLRAVLDELTEGRGQVTILLGEAGLGKTRLVGELRALASEHATWLEGNCFSYGTDIVFGPFLHILRTWIGAEEGEAGLSLWTKLRAQLGLLPASQLSDVLPYLARFLSLKLDPEDEERLRRLSPHELAVELRRSYRTWIESLARQGPVVVAIEDIHWTDPSSRELIDELHELVERTPLLLLATTRIDPDSEGWKVRIRALSDYPHRTTELRLAPLDDGASRLLLRALPTTAKLTDVELDLILTRAEGNPLYLEELASAFASSGRARSDQTWALTVTVPRLLTPTLDSLLLAKVDALPPRCRRLAQVGAVVGRSFPLRVLEHVAESDDIEGDLAALLRADVIREHRRHPEPEYIFRHGLLWQACLSTLPPARRRELHGTVGTAFETLFAGSLDPHLEVIAYHFSRSRNLDKALDYLERAGERAASLDANQSAEELWRRALKVAQKLGAPERIRRIEGVLTELEARPSG